MSIRLSPRLIAIAAIAPFLGGCDMIVLDPAGDIARQQGNLIVVSTVLMLLIIIPVVALTIFFAWKYRAANEEAEYQPDWDHSTQLELVIWAAPLLIIICLGAITWVATHLLDPWRALQPPVAEGQTLQATQAHRAAAPLTSTIAEVKPLEVQVVALDWKWLFIYPEQGIATVNEFAAPIHRPIRFRISSSTVMNSFYIPALAGQIYAMPGMETRLHAAFDQPGNFTGLSANYSGAGFSGMRFAARSLSQEDFDSWVNTVRGDSRTLDRTTYLALAKPSENAPVAHYSGVEPNLFNAVTNMCVEPGKMCMHDMMAIDARGGMGLAGIHAVTRVGSGSTTVRGTTRSGERVVVAGLCTTMPEDRSLPWSKPGNPAPLTGLALTRPDARSANSVMAFGRDDDGPATRTSLAPLSLVQQQ